MQGSWGQALHFSRGGQKGVFSRNGEMRSSPRARIDNTMVKALARAFRWRRMLETGAVVTIREIAAKEKINESYVGRVLRLTLLAPEIVEAILDGRQAPEMTLPMLMKPFPAEWDHQNRLVQNDADPAGAPSSPRPPRRDGFGNKPVNSSKEMPNV